jgi:hypothetical protein
MINHPSRSKINGEEIAVVVTTQHRGVFFGYIAESEIEAAIIHLRAARNCIFWPAETRGFMGLAANGPGDGARVGPAADISLRDITSVIKCEPDAIKAWEKAPWSR